MYTNTKIWSTSSRRLTSLKREMTWRRGTPTAKRVLLCCGVVLGRAPRVQSLALVSLLATVRRSAPLREPRVASFCSAILGRAWIKIVATVTARDHGGKVSPLWSVCCETAVQASVETDPSPRNSLPVHNCGGEADPL